MIYTTTIPCPNQPDVSIEVELDETGLLRFEVVEEARSTVSAEALEWADGYCRRHTKSMWGPVDLHPSDFHTFSEVAKVYQAVDEYGYRKDADWYEVRSNEEHTTTFQCGETGFLMRATYLNGVLEVEPDGYDLTEWIEWKVKEGQLTKEEAEARAKEIEEELKHGYRQANRKYVSNLHEAAKILAECGADPDSVDWN